MFILLIVSKNSQRIRCDIRKLTASIRSKKYEVVVFFTEEAVKLLKIEGGDLQNLPKGVKLLACRTKAMDYGLNKQEELIYGAEMSSLGELVELIEEADRAIFLGD